MFSNILSLRLISSRLTFLRSQTCQFGVVSLVVWLISICCFAFFLVTLRLMTPRVNQASLEYASFALFPLIRFFSLSLALCHFVTDEFSVVSQLTVVTLIKHAPRISVVRIPGPPIILMVGVNSLSSGSLSRLTFWELVWFSVIVAVSLQCYSTQWLWWISLPLHPFTNMLKNPV